MFTGIIKSGGKVKNIRKSRGGIAVSVSSSALSGLKKGASIAVNGICFTVTTFSRSSFSFFAMPETIRKTTVGSWKKGQKVNLEKSLHFGEELGGHLVSGHIEGVGEIAIIIREGRARLWKIEAPRAIIALLRRKGSVAIDGVSLTVADVGKNWFSVALIPYTLAHTTLGEKKQDDSVNIETDMLMKYAKKTKTDK